MPTPNQRISEYLLDSRIGAGTFGEVWRARHHVWHDQLVAIKIPTDPQYVRNLQREGVAIHGLQHPNIVRAMGFDPYADPPYLVMEYIPGKSLRGVLSDRKRLAWTDAVAVMQQVLSGLMYAHKSNVLHRDLKPENILIHERAFSDGFAAEGVVKVTDFGLGKVANQAVVGSILYSQSIDVGGGKEIAGTLDYMAPEQRSGGDIDGRADLYACGVILYELLTGERPAGTDVPSDLNNDVPKFLDEVFKHSYARLEKRYASAGEFLAALTPPPSATVPPPLPRAAMNQNAAHGGVGGGAQNYRQQHSPICPQCRKPIEAGDQFCMHCGVQLVASVRRCAKCGAYPDGSDRYCIFCGETLSAEAVV